MFCELLKFSNYQKHTMYWIPLLGHPVGRHVRLKQQIIKRSYTYMHLTHNKTYLCRVFSKISFDPLRLCFANESRCLFPKELWISIGSSMNPPNHLYEFPILPVIYTFQHGYIPKFPAKYLIPFGIFGWLGQPPCPILSLLVLAWLDQGPLSQCKLAKATHRFPRLLSLASILVIIPQGLHSLVNQCELWLMV